MHNCTNKNFIHTISRDLCIAFELIIYQICLLACNKSKSVKWPHIPQLKLWNTWEYSPIFEIVHVSKNIWRIINTSSFHLTLIICLHTCPWTLSVPWRSQYSSDKHLGIFLHQMVTIVYIYSSNKLNDRKNNFHALFCISLSSYTRVTDME